MAKKTNKEPATTEKAVEYYYAMLPASKNESKTGDLYFWSTHCSVRGIPSDYGWSPDPEDAKEGYHTSKRDLIEKLVNTLALDIDRGKWSMEEATSVEIYKVTEKVVTTTEVTVEPANQVTEKAITEIGEEKYCWNGHEETTTCPRCGEEGVPYGSCPHCGYDIH